MSDDSDTSDVFSEIYPLVIASLTGEITQDQVAQLEELVCNDPQARRLYAQLISESVNLRTWAESACEQAAAETTVTPTTVTPRRRSTVVRWVAAASLLACLLAGWIFMKSREDKPLTVSTQQLELETMAVIGEAQSVLDLLNELERENDTIVRLLDQDAGNKPMSQRATEPLTKVELLLGWRWSAPVGRYLREKLHDLGCWECTAGQGPA